MSLVYIKKKKGFDLESNSLKNDISSNLNIKLKSLEIYNGYIIENANKDDLAKIIENVLRESDEENYEKINTDNKSVITYKLLEGQFDQRAESASQCIKLLGLSESIKVYSFSSVLIYPKRTNVEIQKIKNYLINPVESCAFDPSKFKEISDKKPIIKNEEINIKGKSKNEIKKLIKDLSLSMSEEDLLYIFEYFKSIKRNPKVLEIKVLDTYWSDHCRHTTFNTVLNLPEKYHNNNKTNDKNFNLIKNLVDKYDLLNENFELSLMNLATYYTKKNKLKFKDLDLSKEINACSFNINVKEKTLDNKGKVVSNKNVPYLLMFKNETHNHPTEIEPFGGAATCLGGAIRDPLSGRSIVYQAMRITGAADINESYKDTLKDKLMQKRISYEAMRGYSSYGNQMGIATGLVDEIYSEGYKAKRLELGAVVGAAPKYNVIRKEPAAGDIVMLIGGKTGRDGIGGATGSSKHHSKETVSISGAEVQKGNPTVEKSIQRLFSKSEFSRLIKRCNDFGAGGVSVAVGELADSIDIFLDKIPKKYAFLNEIDLALSESQERMAIVIKKRDVKKVNEFLKKENLSGEVIALITNTGYLRMFYEKQKVFSIKRDFLDTNGIKRKAFADPTLKSPFNSKNEIKREKYKKLNNSIKKGIIDNFDSTIGAGSVLMPLGGKNQITEQVGMVAKIPVNYFNVKDKFKVTNDSSVLTYSITSKNGDYFDTEKTIVASVAKAVCLGATPKNIKLSFQEYYGKLNTPKKWGFLFSILLSALNTQNYLNIPAIGGKDSMSGSYEDIDVPPTFVSFACSDTNADIVVSSEFKTKGNSIYFLDLSKYFKNDNLNNKSDDIKGIALKKVFTFVNNILKNKILDSISFCEGDLKNLIIKNCLGNEISLDVRKGFNFNKEYFGFVFEVKNDTSFKNSFKRAGLSADLLLTLGILNKKNILFGMSLLFHKNALTKQLDNVFPIVKNDKELKPLNSKINSLFNENLKTPEQKKFDGLKILKAKPTVFIPVFPGTNCEIDSKYAFIKAGANVSMFNIRNQTKNDLEDSIRIVKKEIEKSQMIFLPGGFSFSDEPGGSAKGIVNFFKNDHIKEATLNLYKNKNGLLLGICNGFQALVKLGLLPFGEIIVDNKNEVLKNYLSIENNKDLNNIVMPNLLTNTIGRHISLIASMKPVNKISPWLKHVNLNTLYHNPISHGQGRFYAGDEILKKMIENKQIAFVYADEKLSVVNKPEVNYNGSLLNIEGITSKDGRILGKMGHAERIGENLYKNVPGNYDLKLFTSSVEYFK